MDKESYLIERLNSKYIGDDGAVVGDTIYSMDAFCEDTHFKREWLSLKEIARKSMLVNISDAIAMNAKPKFILLSISIPNDFSKDDIDEIMKSFMDTADEFNCEIIGGDTIGGDKLNISITVISQSHNPLKRIGLEENDLLAFTGKLGESKRDLEALFRGEQIDKESKFISPKLKADFIYEAREYLNCGMDISDGLFCDTNKLLDANNLGFKSTIEIDRDIGLSGEEYEMLIGFNENNYDKILSIAKKNNTPITIFAKATKNKNRFYCESHHFK